jgi:hypothetical protein
VWLAIALLIIALGIVLVVIAGFSTWGRWKRMQRAGGSFLQRVDSLAVSADLVATRLQAAEPSGSDD